MSVAVNLNTDWGELKVNTVSVAYGSENLSGLLYVPKSASAVNQVPSIVLAHGISSAKQSMSGIALELAKCGFVALALDLVGHGNSEGRLAEGSNDASLGVSAAVRFLKLQPYVNGSAIGLVGHSLGAGAIRAAAAIEEGVSACVFIGGGFGSMVDSPSYGVLNSTFPKNLLVVVGRFDVLFNLTQLIQEELPPVFDTSSDVVPSVIYGDFERQTARELIVPSTTHLFEPVDPFVVSETVEWMAGSLLNKSSVLISRIDVGFVYLYREAAILVGLFAFVGMILVLGLIVLERLKVRKIRAEPRFGVLEDWKVFVVWGFMGLALFLPMLFLGLLIPFPPVLFGGSIAWWLLTVGVACLFVLRFMAPRFSSVNLRLRSGFSGSFSLKGFAVALGLFCLMYVVASVLEEVFVIDLRIFVPIFNILWPSNRVSLFFVFIPFFFVYFFCEGLLLHELRNNGSGLNRGVGRFRSALKVVLIKVTPYAALILLQYVPWVLFGFPVFPSYVGFLVEFLWLLVPVFFISTFCSWWFYRITLSIGTGAIFNMLLFAWAAAVIFPF
jgi:dienelactone hydrolase